jgi:3-hydroxybutyryl-CoA dehydrogenase
MKIQKIFIVGAGTMGNGIAQTAAVSGYDVTMMDVDPAAIERAKKTIDKSTAKFLEKEKISAEQREAALNLTTATDMSGAAEADLVIEAATENPSLKFKIFTELDEVAKPGIILASNTSSISLTKIAAATKRPDEVVGMHFFNPVPMMTLVEVIRGLQTSDETTETVIEMAKAMGKVPVEAKDSPGFISNRILCPMLNEAIFAYGEGIGSREAIDTVMELGMAHKMGPLKLSDLVGLDVILNVMEVLHHDLGEDKYRPAPLLRQMVDAGYLGKKSGRGFYEYD